MKYTISKNFDKDLKNINKNMLIEIDKILEDIGNANSLLDIKNIKKLNSRKIDGIKYYRIRIGDYRLAMVLNNGNLIFKKIYA